MDQCAVCQEPCTKKCGRCKSVFYCSGEHQKSHWKSHKRSCNDVFQADQYTLHKQEFDRIAQKYGLKSDQKAGLVAEYLTSASSTSASGKVSAADFAAKFGTTEAEAVVFLEWIKVGVQFKEQSIDTAKAAGFSGSSSP